MCVFQDGVREEDDLAEGGLHSLNDGSSAAATGGDALCPAHPHGSHSRLRPHPGARGSSQGLLHGLLRDAQAQVGGVPASPGEQLPPGAGEDTS